LGKRCSSAAFGAIDDNVREEQAGQLKRLEFTRRATSFSVAFKAGGILGGMADVKCTVRKGWWKLWS